MAAALRQFLVRLSVDPQLLAEFIKCPLDVLAKADLSESERTALVSRDQSRIMFSISEDRLDPGAETGGPS